MEQEIQIQPIQEESGDVRVKAMFQGREILY